MASFRLQKKIILSHKSDFSELWVNISQFWLFFSSQDCQFISKYNVKIIASIQRVLRVQESLKSEFCSQYKSLCVWWLCESYLRVFSSSALLTEVSHFPISCWGWHSLRIAEACGLLVVKPSLYQHGSTYPVCHNEAIPCAYPSGYNIKLRISGPEQCCFQCV